MDENIRKQAAWLTWIYQGVEDGKKLQMRVGVVWFESPLGPNLNSHPTEWRFKPEPR